MKELIKSISRNEWRFVILLVLVMIIITNLLLFYGWLNTPQNYIFTGIHFAMPNDWSVYYSYLEQVKQGHWLFTDLFASEPHQPVLNIFWLGVGLLGKFFNLPNVVTFNLAKTILIPVFYFVAYLFLAYLFTKSKTRQLALLLLSVASGLGTFLSYHFILYPTNVFAGQFTWPMDLWLPDINTFLTLFTSPHFIASLTLIIIIFFLTLLFEETGRIAYSFWSGLFSLILLAFHPFHAPTIFSVILVYFIILMLRQRKIIWPLVVHYLILLALSLPAIWYYFYLIQTDFVMQQKALQNITPTTPLAITLVSYGLLLPLALIGLYWLFKNRYFSPVGRSNKWLFISIWLVVQFCLIYLPLAFQRRLTEGLHFPLIILSTIGLLSLAQWLKRQKNKVTRFLFPQRLTLWLVIGSLLVSSTVFLLVVDFTMYQNQVPLAYLSRSAVEAMQWFKRVDFNSIIFNADDAGVNFIPAYAGRRVYVGHGVETPYYLSKQREVSWFFSRNRNEKTEKNFLVQRRVNYIFYSSREKSLGSYDPTTKSYLQEVYSNSEVKIYQVL